jgi:hypothetical protein
MDAILAPAESEHRASTQTTARGNVGLSELVSLGDLGALGGQRAPFALLAIRNRRVRGLHQQDTERSRS